MIVVYVKFFQLFTSSSSSSSTSTSSSSLSSCYIVLLLSNSDNVRLCISQFDIWRYAVNERSEEFLSRGSKLRWSALNIFQQRLWRYLLAQNFLIRFVKISQVTASGWGSGLPWPATPQQVKGLH